MRGYRVLWSNAVISVAASGCVLRSWCMSHHGGPNAELPWVFALGIGAATWLAYTWQRHVKSTRSHGLRPAHLQWFNAHKHTFRWVGIFMLPFAVLPLVRTATLAGSSQSSALLLIAGLCVAGLLTLLYAGLPGEKGLKLALRRLPRLKLLWIGLTWSVITALWPAVLDANSAAMESGNLYLVALERALVIMALTLPFDLRDRNWDPPFMKTLPQQWGTRGTRIAAVVMLIAATAASAIATQGSLEFGFGPLIMIPLVAWASDQRTPLYYALLDATLILDAAMVLALS